MKKTAFSQFIRNHVRSISAKNRINFFRQMAILTRAGITLLGALQMLRRSAKGPLKRLIGDAIDLIEQGNDFSKIGKYYVTFFDRTIASMLRAGEQTGMLPEVMQQVFENLERSSAFRRKVRGAMMMPLLTLVIAVGVVFFLALYVIPQFAGFLDNMGAELPPITRFVVDFSNYIVAHWKDLLLYAGSGAGTYFALYALIRPFRYAMHHLFLRLPLIGPLILFTALSNFANSMAKLIGSGIGVVESLRIADEGVRLLPLRTVLKRASDTVLAGGNVSTAFEQSRLLPSIFTDLLIAGEQSGTLDDVFEQLAVIYREEADYKIGALQGAIQPVMTILIGGIVGVVAASLILGMVALWSKQGGG